MALGESPASRTPAVVDARGIDRERYPYRMRELCEKTGLPRQVVHFYIQQGLVPEGHKTSKNMAYYCDEHVQRINLVRRLQHERFMPLKAIRAFLEDRSDAFSTEQRVMLHQVRERLSQLTGVDEPITRLALTDVFDRYPSILPDEIDDLEEIGLLGIARLDGEPPAIAQNDEWVIELLHELRLAGFTRARGFGVKDFALYVETIDRLFDHEKATMTTRFDGLPADQVATLIERSLPLINTFLARYHTARIRQFFTTI
ncbi:MAG: MerR family transcriptional regulator [Polyangiales bacterium]